MFFDCSRTLSKQRFLKDLDKIFYKSEKLQVIYQSTNKVKVDFKMSIGSITKTSASTQSSYEKGTYWSALVAGETTKSSIKSEIKVDNEVTSSSEYSVVMTAKKNEPRGIKKILDFME